MSVAENCRVASRPLPHRSRTDNLRVRHLLRLGKVARSEADRAQPELSAGLGELLPEPLERRAVLADDTLHLSRKTEPHRVLGGPDDDLLALLLRGSGHEESDEHALAVLH